MSIEKNKQIVLSMLDALANRDAKAAAVFMADDAIYNIVGNPEQFSFAGPYNKEEVTELWTGFLGSFDSFNFNVISILAEDDKVAVKAVSEGNAQNGKFYNNNYLMYFEISDGQIILANEFCDQLHVIEFMK